MNRSQPIIFAACAVTICIGLTLAAIKAISKDVHDALERDRRQR